jgi:hypothetical protein
LQNLLLSGLTQEEQLVEALKPAGPVVAVGRPGERLPPVGARRIYLVDDESANPARLDAKGGLSPVPGERGQRICGRNPTVAAERHAAAVIVLVAASSP